MDLQLRMSMECYARFLILSIFFFSSCAVPRLPPFEESWRKEAEVMPRDVAIDIISKYKGREWAEKPFIEYEIKKFRWITYPPPGGSFEEIYTDRKRHYFEYLDALIYGILDPKCIRVKVLNNLPFPRGRYPEYYGHEKSDCQFVKYDEPLICARSEDPEEIKRIIVAFLSLNCNFKRSPF